MSPTATALKIRSFVDTDYAAMLAISQRCYPGYPETEKEARHGDETWDHAQFLRLRFVAEDETGRAVGFAQINHMPGQFHPQRFAVNVMVDPDQQQQGYGSALYDHLLLEARQRHADRLRGFTRADKPASLRFLERRGFTETLRSWESRLPVAEFDFSQFANADARAAAAGMTLTTLAELMTGDSESVMRQLYDLDMLLSADVPAVEPFTRIPFDTWRQRYVGGPNFLPDAWYFAVIDGEWAGMSNLWRSAAEPQVLWQGLTALKREHRGKGIAMALKLQTVRYARANGYTEIRTFNESKNRAMLRINEAMGFVKQPIWIEFSQTLTPN